MKDRLISIGGFFAGLVLLAGIPLLFDQLETGRVFMSWPNGSIWSNMLSNVWWIGIGAYSTWYFKERIGKRLSAWWAENHPHTGILQELREQVAEAREHAAEAKDHALAARHIAADHYEMSNGGPHRLAPPLPWLTDGEGPPAAAGGPLPEEPSA